MTTILKFASLDGKFWAIRYNEDSKHVKTVGGRVGTLGYTRRFHFETREDVRNYVDSRIEVKTGKGFRAIAA